MQNNDDAFLLKRFFSFLFFSPFRQLLRSLMLLFEIIETTMAERTEKNQSELNKYSDKSFSFLSADEIEKLKQENEKKIATITRETKKKFASSTTTTTDNINNNDQFDINDNEYQLIINQHEVEDEDEDANMR